RTLPQMLPVRVLDALKQAEGAPISNAGFEILPLLTSPSDMYAVAVLAVRVLLVDDENTLAIALDEILSLARELAIEYRPDLAFGERLRAIIERDRRWAVSLAPQGLVSDESVG